MAARGVGVRRCGEVLQRTNPGPCPHQPPQEPFIMRRTALRGHLIPSQACHLGPPPPSAAARSETFFLPATTGTLLFPSRTNWRTNYVRHLASGARQHLPPAALASNGWCVNRLFPTVRAARFDNMPRHLCAAHPPTADRSATSLSGRSTSMPVESSPPSAEGTAIALPPLPLGPRTLGKSAAAQLTLTEADDLTATLDSCTDRHPTDQPPAQAASGRPSKNCWKPDGSSLINDCFCNEPGSGLKATPYQRRPARDHAMESPPSIALLCFSNPFRPLRPRSLPWEYRFPPVTRPLIRRLRSCIAKRVPPPPACSQVCQGFGAAMDAVGAWEPAT